ncbi:hypothetical protein V7150_18460 [Neobacillus drentensis]|uniref:DUF7716 domain-containing protein n=1 Tax=Neobacillus drentensis TaxID=220684 RepID=UPI003000A4EE
MDSLTELKYILNNVNELPWNEYLFLPIDKKWTIDSVCSVINWDELDEDELEGDGDTPIFAIDNNLIFVLDIATIQDIVNNAKQQRPQCSALDLFQAFMYYYNNDAFITFE